MRFKLKSDNGVDAGFLIHETLWPDLWFVPMTLYIE